MLKIVEIKETIEDTKIIDNIYTIERLIRNMKNDAEFIKEINYHDYTYIKILLERSIISLQKANEILKFQQ